MVIEGKVIQKIDGRLLVDSADTRKEEYQRQEIENLYIYPNYIVNHGPVTFFTDGVQVYDGLCLLTDYASEGNVVDGDVVRTAAYPNGKYTYTAVSGNSKTVRQFTCNANLVLAAPDENELKNIKLARPVGP